MKGQQPLILACIDCGKDRTAKAQRPGRCPACKKEHARKRAALGRAEGRWKKAEPSAQMVWNLRRNYGLTVAQYEEMTKNGCYVCGSFNRLCVDHDHRCCDSARSCGKCIRGVLCDACNSTLGRVHDDPQWLRKLADYLESGK
jgi:Recombination endonuclease VII